MIRACLIFLLLNLTCSSQWGNSIATQPLGVTNITVVAAGESSPGYTFISSSYNQEPAYSGFIDGINDATLTLDGLVNFFDVPGYQEDELVETAHLLKLRDGNPLYHGMVFPLLGNKENDVVIGVPPDDVTTYFTVGDAVDIIQANTLEGLFGKGEDFHGLAGTPSKADNILIWTTYGWKTYFYYDDKWQTYGTRSDQSSTIIYPDEGMVYIRRGNDPLVFSFSGHVPYVVQTYLPPPAGKFLMSNPFPIEMTLSQLIDTDSNWSKSNDVNESDQILCWTGTAWTTYHVNTANDWISIGSGEIDDREVQAGESFFILRSSNPASSITPGYNKIDIPE